jgi:Dyp-type peroxidase family
VPLRLDRPLAWKAADADATRMLTELQANIVKPHVRDHLAVMFFNFSNRSDGRAFMQTLVPFVKSALQHLQEIEVFKTSGKKIPGSVYVGVGLSRAGYKALGITSQPPDPSFKKGMKAQRTVLADPLSSGWDSTYRHELHAVVLIGDAANRAAVVNAARTQVLAARPATVTLVGEERGLSQHNSNGDGIEHFGYVDGRSQPLFLVEDIAGEARANWNPAFPLEQLIVTDPAVSVGAQKFFGSYFVFRKLEQNVRLFKKQEEELAAALKLAPGDEERAGAMVVGRFEDGTPATLQQGDKLLPVPNDFNYRHDPDGLKCPFGGHIRKTNPRGSGGFEPEADERKHLMARRGQTFGVRADDVNADLPPEKRPTGGVGLLFMAFNANLGNQFEFTQGTWANNPGFPNAPFAAGVDAVMGQGSRTKQRYSTTWNTPPLKEGDVFAQAVTMRGGDYFFMPSLAFLRSI